MLYSGNFGNWYQSLCLEIGYSTIIRLAGFEIIAFEPPCTGGVLGGYWIFEPLLE